MCRRGPREVSYIDNYRYVSTQDQAKNQAERRRTRESKPRPETYRRSGTGSDIRDVGTRNALVRPSQPRARTMISVSRFPGPYHWTTARIRKATVSTNAILVYTFGNPPNRAATYQVVRARAKTTGGVRTEIDFRASTPARRAPSGSP